MVDRLAVRRLAGSALSAALVLVVGACGGDRPADSSQAEARDAIARTVEAYAEALDTRDADAACQLLDPSQLRSQFGSLDGCIRAIERLMKRGTFAITSTEITGIRIVDEGATVDFEDGSFLELHEEDERWYVRLVF